MDQELSSRIESLRLKYATSGQELLDFLDGLIEADYITYWDYIRLDSLLSLQQPRTSHPDESVFIMYHQITELYFKLCLHELRPQLKNEQPEIELLAESIRRCNRYFEALEHSFSVMVEGMDRKQFLKFRMSLIPASGFQSAQYRMIELALARLNDLVNVEKREALADEKDVSVLLDEIYWKRGATIEDSGQKTLTLLQFENKYGDEFRSQAEENRGNTISDQSKRLFDEGLLTQELQDSLRELDQHVNPLVVAGTHSKGEAAIDSQPPKAWQVINKTINRCQSNRWNKLAKIFTAKISKANIFPILVVKKGKG